MFRQNNIKKLVDLKTDAFDRYHHTYPASYLWVFMDGKFVRDLTEYGDVLMRRGALVRIPCNHGSTKQFKSVYKEIARLHQQIRFYISFAFDNIIG